VLGNIVNSQNTNTCSLSGILRFMDSWIHGLPLYHQTPIDGEKNLKNIGHFGDF